jgi:hypothetical protein
MPRLTTFIWLPLLVGAILFGSAQAQILLPGVTVSGRIFEKSNSCENAPDKCAGSAWISETGVCEFHIYPSWQIEAGSDSSKLALGWPEAWTVISWETCQAELVSGDPYVPESILLFAYDDCWDFGYSRPFLRMVVDCPTPGRFRIGTISHACGGDWVGEGGFQGYHVEVGEYCGMLIHGGCDYCPRSLAGHFSPSSLSLVLPPGEAHVDTIDVSGDWVPPCPTIDECGDDFSPCSDVVSEDIPWASVEEIEGGDHHRKYHLLVDAGDLVPGVYEDKIYLGAICDACESTCMPLKLTVLEPSAAPVGTKVPLGYRLGPIHPSPFHGEIRISLRLPHQDHVTLRIYDVTGTRVRTLADGMLGGGRHRYQWTGRNDSGDEVPSGIYFVRMESTSYRMARRVILLR